MRLSTLLLCLSVFADERDDIRAIPPIDTRGMIPKDNPLQIEEIVPDNTPFVQAPGIKKGARSLSLNEALIFTFQNQISLQIANLNVELAKGVLRQNAGPFDYNVEAVGGYTDERNIQDMPDKSVGDGSVTEGAVSVNTLTRPGTSFSMSLAIDKTHSPFNAPSLQNEGSLAFVVKQPLLKGFLTGMSWMQEKSSLYALYSSYFADFQTMSQGLYNTAVAYWAAVGAKRALSIQEEGVRRVAMLTSGVQEVIDNGQLARWEVLQPVRQELVQESSLVAAEQTLYAAVQSLLTTMGDVSVEELQDTPLSLHDKFPKIDLDTDSFEEQFGQYLSMVRLRYDVQAALLQQKSVEYLVKGAKNSCLPSLDITGTLSGNNFELGSAGRQPFAPILMRKPQANYGLTVSLSFPIYNDSALGFLKQKQAQYAQAVLNVQQLQEQAITAIRTALSNQQLLSGQIRLLRDQINANRQLYNNGVIALRAGLLSLYDLLSFEERLTNSLIGETTYLQQYMQNIALLRFLTSTLFSQAGDPHCITLEKIEELPDLSIPLQQVTYQNIDGVYVR